MDFIIDLLLSIGCEQLWVIIDKYTKMTLFIRLKKQYKMAEDLPTIFTRDIWRLHCIPVNLICDWDARLTSKFRKSLIARLIIRPWMLTVFQPQTEGQTERINHTIEIFLQSFVNLHQTECVELLRLAKFAYNNSTTSTHRMTVFYPNYSYHPSSGTKPTEANILFASSVAYRH
jgi:hypothetical protein